MFLIYAFYKRRRGVPFNELLDFKHLRGREKSEKPPLEKSNDSMPRPEEARVWNAASTFAIATVEKIGMSRGPQKPKMVMIRANSNSSSTLDQSREPEDKKPASLPPVERSFFDQASISSGGQTTAKISRRPLETNTKSYNSSPVIPAIGSVSQSESRNTRDRTITSSSSPFMNTDLDPSTPLQPPPPVDQDNFRFTWPENASLEPSTPRFALHRQSAAISNHSSVPRFRKIDSWVSNQTGRINSALLRSQPGYASDGGSSSSNGKPRAKVWKAAVKGDEQYDEDRETLVGPATFEEEEDEREKEEREAREGHARQTSDATVFRQHPGVRLPGPRHNVMASADLDAKFAPVREI